MSDDQPKFCLLSASAVMPVRGTSRSCGFDLYSSYSVSIPAGQRIFVDTGCGVLLPTGHFGHIMPRSGLSKNSGISVLGGVIDEDYRGTLGVILLNTSAYTVDIPKEKAIAQLVIIKNNMEPAMQISPKQFLATPTERNTAGFGSTDKPPAKKVKFFDWNPSCLLCKDDLQLAHSCLGKAHYPPHSDVNYWRTHMPNELEPIQETQDPNVLTDEQFERVLSSTLSE